MVITTKLPILRLRFQGVPLSLRSKTPALVDAESSESDDEPSQKTHLEPDFSADNESESEDGPDWMFDEGEVRSSDAEYIFCPAAHRAQILHIFTKHFCQHPLLPEHDGAYLTQEQIQTWAVEEMYTFCFQHGLAEVWAYLWTSWYSPSKWILWARSTSSYLFCL